MGKKGVMDNLEWNGRDY